MTRHCLAYVAAAALTAAAAPAFAQAGPPPPGAMPPGPPPGWVDPQAPQYPGPDGMPREGYRHGPDGDGPDHAGVPFRHPLPPGAYPDGPGRYPPGPMMPAPMPWGGPGPAYGGYGYANQYGAGPATCGCAALPPVMWVPVPVETRYRYSAPIRHERQIVEERVVRERVVETKTVPVRREAKYVKSAPHPKYTKDKVVRTTK